jgi:hypothetical protein
MEPWEKIRRDGINFARAAKLQDWLQTAGYFSYVRPPSEGTPMAYVLQELLVDFLYMASTNGAPLEDSELMLAAKRAKALHDREPLEAQQPLKQFPSRVASSR